MRQVWGNKFCVTTRSITVCNRVLLLLQHGASLNHIFYSQDSNPKSYLRDLCSALAGLM